MGVLFKFIYNFIIIVLLMVTPLIKRDILKKRTKSFIRFQSDRKAGTIKPNWRRPKGIDCAVRRKFKGRTLMPNIGYGSNNMSKHVLPNGFMKILINNVKELNILLMFNRVFAAEISHSVSSRKRKLIIEHAKQLGINLLNGSARVKINNFC